jgi:alpha-ribazole phosphatase
MLVHLLRHGETEGGARYWGGMDVALSSRGWLQMKTAVAGRSWDLIVSSPLRRCAAFAEALAQERRVPCRLEADLREMCFGTWEGYSTAELMQRDAERLRLFWSDPSVHTPPGGEPLAELYARVMAVWQRLSTASDCGRVLIVTHGGPIRVLRAVQARTPLSALLSIDVPHATVIGIERLLDGSVAADARESRLSASAEHR